MFVICMLSACELGNQEKIYRTEATEQRKLRSPRWHCPQAFPFLFFINCMTRPGMGSPGMRLINFLPLPPVSHSSLPSHTPSSHHQVIPVQSPVHSPVHASTSFPTVSPTQRAPPLPPATHPRVGRPKSQQAPPAIESGFPEPPPM